MIDTEIYIKPEVSKEVLNLILNNKKIEYKKFGLLKYRDKIEKIVKEFKSQNIKNKNLIRNHFFWKIVIDIYQDHLNIKIKKKNQISEKKRYDVNFQEISKSLGYNPSLLSLIIFENKIKKILQTNNFFKELELEINLENIGIKQKLNILDCLIKKNLNIFTPLCPDYEHVKITENLYKYTFNKLGEGYGLIGKKYLKIYGKLNSLLKKYKIQYKSHIYYGDFEGFAVNNCKKLKETEETFIKKVEKSSLKINSKCSPSSGGLIVRDLTSKKEWLKKCELNKKKIKDLYSKDKYFKRSVLEICNSRKKLYSSWFSDKKEDDYLEIVFTQGAEYTTISDLVKKKFKNPFFLCLDHSKMQIFYNINNSVPVVYSRPHYL
jgi:hypothetical protein